jgi:hypothetical protein
LYSRFASKLKKRNYDDPEEFRRAFKTIMSVDKEKDRHNGEYLMHLERELEVYRGNVKAEAINEGETMSTLSVASSLRKTGRGNSPDAKSVRIGMDQENAVKRDRAKFDVMLGQN